MAAELNRYGSRLTTGQTDVLAKTVLKLPLSAHGRSNHCAGSPMIFFPSCLWHFVTEIILAEIKRSICSTKT